MTEVGLNSLKRDLFRFCLAQYEANRTGVKMQWFAQRFAKRYLRLRSGDPGAQSFADWCLEFASPAGPLHVTRAENGTAYFIPRDIYMMHILMGMDAVTMAKYPCAETIPEDVIMCRVSGPSVTANTRLKCVARIDELTALIEADSK